MRFQFSLTSALLTSVPETWISRISPKKFPDRFRLLPTKSGSALDL
jgi:hypothetical protein